jgi:hypothetical protein
MAILEKQYTRMMDSAHYILLWQTYGLMWYAWLPLYSGASMLHTPHSGKFSGNLQTVRNSIFF